MSAKTCDACARRARERYEAAMGRRRTVVNLLVAAAFVALVASLYAVEAMGDLRMGAVGIVAAVGCLFFASEAEVS